MYYRYEVRRAANDPWEGCFQYLFPDQRRFLGRWIKEPKWYQNHPFTNSRCWFTQEGFEKYGDLVEEVVKERMENFSEGEMRILKRPKLENIVMHGKIQCIQLI